MKNTNDPPIIITESDKKVTVGETYSVDYEAVDIDPPPLALTWSVNSNALNWLSMDTVTGWLHGDPTNNDVGTYWVNISVDDNNGGYDYQNFTVTVESSGETISKEETSWFWLIIVIILIIIVLAVSMYLFYKRKVARIPTVRAELLPPKPEQKTLSTPYDEEVKPLQSEPQVLQNLPSQDIQVQQLPQSTLTNAQKLNLLKERLIRGEVTEDTYKELKKEIEDSQDSDKTLEDENVEE